MAKQWLNCVIVCAVFTLALNGLASSKFSSDRHCSKYHILNEPWRSVQVKSTDLHGRHHCDNTDGFETTRWYRFMGEAGTAMPTEPPPSSHRCGSEAPVWMNGIDPTYEDEMVERQVCARFGRNTCSWKWKIRVKRCPEGFLIYKLKPVKACSVTYCGLGVQNMTIDDVTAPASNENEDGSGALDKREEVPVAKVNRACLNYITMDEPQRSVHNQIDPNAGTNTLLCDKRSEVEHGHWYRFVGEGGDIMATERPLSTNRCGTHAPVWMRGPHPTVEEGVVTRTVCAFWDGNDCRWSWEIKVLSCPGEYFVYKLRKAKECLLAYCTTGGALNTTVPPPTPSMSVNMSSDDEDEIGSGEPYIEDVPATESPDNTEDVGSGAPNPPERRTSYLTHHKGWNYFIVPVIGKMTSANVKATCEAAGYVTPCSGDSDCVHSSSECVLTGLTDCNKPMKELAKKLCGTKPKRCAQLRGVYQYMNAWNDGAACGVDQSKRWCAVGSEWKDGYALCATDRNVTTAAPQATTKEPRNCCGNILRQATEVVDQSSGYRVPDGWTMCYIDERDTVYHKTNCRDLLQGIPGYENAKELLVAGGTFGCWHGYTGDSPGPAFATNNVIKSSCQDGVQQDTKLNSWNVLTTTLGVCIKGITCDGAPETTVPPPTPSISDHLLSDDDEDDVGSGEPDDKDREASFLVHYKGWNYFKVRVIGEMTSANVKATCETAGYVTPCSGDSGCSHSSSECVLTGLEDCNNPMNEVAQELCGTKPYGCEQLQGVYQYMNTWSQGAACGVQGSSWCEKGSGRHNRYAFCATDRNVTTTAPQATSAAPTKEPKREGSYLVHYKGWNYYKVPVIGKMTSADVKATCEAAGYVAPCTGDSNCKYSSSECVLTGLKDCDHPMKEVSKELCGTTPTECPQFQGVYQYMNTWSKGAACGVESTWCAIGSKLEDRYAFCADLNATTTAPQTTTAAPQTTTTARDSRNCCGKILRQATKVVDQSSDYRVPDGWTMCYIDERDTVYHDTPCRELLQGIPGYEDAEQLLAAGGNFGCWHGTTGNSPGPAFATNNVIENSCKDGVQQGTRLDSWNRQTTTLGVCIKGITFDGAPQTTVAPPTPSMSDEILSDDEDEVGSGEPDDKVTRKNLALGKRTRQSSLWDAGYASNAVDGDRSTNWYSGSCTHTKASLRDNVWDVGTTDPWWYVDLGSSYPIGKVVIVNRRSPKSSVTSRINPFEIRIGKSKDVTANPKCGGRQVFPADEDVMEVTCGGIQGRYVGIRLPGKNRILTLCEVEVYAEAAPIDDEDGGDVGSGVPYDEVDRLPCVEHVVIQNQWRHWNDSDTNNYCDKSSDIKDGQWHRFMGDGRSMMIPTERPLTKNRCGTHAPVWMKGKLPSEEEGVVTRTACAFWDKDECNWAWDIDVMACPGGYFIYKLPIPPVCQLAYCTTYESPQTTTPSPTMIPAISDGSLGDDEDEVGSGEPHDKGAGRQTTMPSTTTIPSPTEDPASDDDDKDDADSGEVEGSVYSIDNRLACEKHYVLNEPWRSVRTHRERDHKCDQRTLIKHNHWYRFMGEGGTMIPTQRPPATHRCSTHAPVWMKGKHPTVEQGVVRRKVCAFWEEEECHWSWKINVRACPGGYYVYKLPKPKICYSAYCTTDEDTEGSGEPEGSGDMGYTQRGDTQYKIYTEEKTYDAAKQTCAADGGHLVSIETEAVYNFLLGMIRDVDVLKDYWIGLNDQADEQSWTWSDGKPLNDGGFTKWAPGEPNNNEGIQDCGQLWAYKNFQWDDDRCSYKKYFICQIGPGEAYDGDDIIFEGSGEEPLPTQENIKGCPENNIVVLPSGKKYVASDDTKTYEDAQTECRSQGGIVAIPRDEEEQKNLVFLKNCVSRENQFWLGVRWTSEGWVDGRGSPLGGFTTWAPGEPNDRYNGYRCSHIVYGNKEGDRRNNWADAYCNSLYNFVCEIQNAPSWSASSQFDSRHSPDRADINSRETSDKAGAWAAAANNLDQWLMRDLGEVKVVTGVITKGRDYSPDWPYGPHDQYVTSYVISYGVKDGDEKFYTNANNDITVFTGNSDRDAEVYNDLREYSGPVMARFIKIHPRTWHQHISMRMKIVTSDIVPKINASSCSELKSFNPASKDGEYTLYPFSTCQDVSLRVYCHNMASDQPEEFLTLPSGPENNFANIYADRLMDNYGGRCNGPLQDPYSKRAGTTKFNKIRIKFENSMVKVIRNDYTFANTNGYNNVPYGEAGDCYSWKQGCAKGTFSLDLTGTGLSLAPGVQWVMVERYPEYISINDMFISENRAVASARCGGWCGHCWPAEKNLLLSHQQCESNTRNSKAEDKPVKTLYQGCYKDGKRRRLPEALLISEDMTSDVCVKHCRQEGYSYAGTQYYKECWCGTELPHRGPRDDNECATPCGGNQNEMCGGEWRLSVYKVEPVDEVHSEGRHDCQTSDGASYRGTVAVTRSGLTCQRWDRQAPHEHTRTSDNYPSSGLEENYCRNPDGTPGVWCYTTDPNKRWDLCDVPVCVEPTTAVEVPSDGRQGCQTSDGASYRGTVAVTRSGRTCQRWDRQTPHEHTRTSDNYPSSGLEENYCRNPDGTPGVWCYTTDPNKRWDFCDVPVCDVSPQTAMPSMTTVPSPTGRPDSDDDEDREVRGSAYTNEAVPENLATQPPISTEIAAKSVCPISGYIRLRGACYKFFAEPKTYEDARQRCAEDGGLLAMPKDRATNRFVTNHHRGSSWLGLTDINREGRWVYEDGQLLKSSGYSSWARGEPNDADYIEDCAEFTPTRAFWNDAPCNSSKPFTCQIGVTDVTSAIPTPTPEPTSTPTPTLASLSTPKVTTEGKVTVLKTSNVTLKCTLRLRRRHINHRINWYRIGENGTQGAPMITYIDRHAFHNYRRTAELRLVDRLEAVDDHVSLRILKAKVEDSGTYRCEVILASQQRAYADVNMTILECPTEKKKDHIIINKATPTELARSVDHHDHGGQSLVVISDTGSVFPVALFTGGVFFILFLIIGAVVFLVWRKRG